MDFEDFITVPVSNLISLGIYLWQTIAAVTVFILHKKIQHFCDSYKGKKDWERIPCNSVQWTEVICFSQAVEMTSSR